MATPAGAKHRQPRLRASCDGCFLAKVKCSKDRPICSRCLTCGIECRYSPSSRAGKPKASDSSKNHTKNSDMGANPLLVNTGMMYGVHSSMTGLYKLETGWTSPPTSIDESLNGGHSLSSGLAFMGVDSGQASQVDSSAAAEVYGPGIPWTPPSDISTPFAERSFVATMPHGHSRSQSYDMRGSTMGWADTNIPELFSLNQTSTPGSMSNFVPSPSATPNLRPTSVRSKSTPTSPASGSCTCFTVCLQSLQALHNASSPASPPFDLVLSLNRKAVEGCAAMLACSRCMRRSGTHTAAMLLATVIGTITSFYRDASQSYFDHGGSPNGMAARTIPTPSATTTAGMPGLGVSLGAYTVNSEDSRWLELEILARELRKLEEVYANFREVCSELSEDPEVSKAMIGYLGQSLGSTMQVVSHHRNGNMRFS